MPHTYNDLKKELEYEKIAMISSLSDCSKKQLEKMRVFYQFQCIVYLMEYRNKIEAIETILKVE